MARRQGQFETKTAPRRYAKQARSAASNNAVILRASRGRCWRWSRKGARNLSKSRGLARRLWRNGDNLKYHVLHLKRRFRGTHDTGDPSTPRTPFSRQRFGCGAPRRVAYPRGASPMPLVLDAIRVHPCVSVILQSKQSGAGTRAASPELLPRREAALGGFKL